MKPFGIGDIALVPALAIAVKVHAVVRQQSGKRYYVVIRIGNGEWPSRQRTGTHATHPFPVSEDDMVLVAMNRAHLETLLGAPIV